MLFTRTVVLRGHDWSAEVRGILDEFMFGNLMEKNKYVGI